MSGASPAVATGLKKPAAVHFVGAWWAPAVGLTGLGLVFSVESGRTSASREVFFNVPQSRGVYALLAGAGR